MHGKKIVLSAFALIIIILIVIGCKRYFMQPPGRNPVKEARKWFHKKYDDLLLIKPDGSLANGNKYPDWRHIRTYASKYFTVFETPLIEDIRKVWHFKDEDPGAEQVSASMRKLLICERNNRYREAIMTIIPRKQYRDAHPDLSDISLDQVPADFSGIIYYETFTGEYLKGFVYKDGLVTKGLKPNTGQASPENKTMMEFVTTEVVIANCWTYVNHYNGETDELVSTVSTYDESQCSIQDFREESTDCTGGSNPYCNCENENIEWVSCGYGSIGGTTHAPFNSRAAVPVVTTDLLQDSFPCLNALIKDSISKYWLSNVNTYAQFQLRNIFNIERYMHLTFSIDYSLGQGNAAARASNHAASWIDDDEHFHFQDTIFFNPYYMTHGTKEFKVATILHEALHVFVDYTFEQYKRFEIDSNEVKARFPLYWGYFSGNRPPPATSQHEAMAQTLAGDISHMVGLMYNKSAPAALRDSCSKALAWGGLEKTSPWFALPDTCNIRAINIAAENGLTGGSFNLGPGSQCRTYSLNYSDSLKMTAPCK